MSVESHVIGMCARAGPLEQGREARSGSTQRDETKTILHIWQSTEQSDPFDDLHGDVGAQLGQKSFEDVRGALDGDVHADERL